MTAAVSPSRVPAQSSSGVEGIARGLATLTLCGGAFFAPYLTWRPYDIMFTLSDMMLCAAALLLSLGGFAPRRPFGALTPWWLLGFVLMAAGLLLGSIVNGEPLRWAIAAAQYAFALVVLPHLLIGHGPSRTAAIAKSMLAGVVAMELFGIAVYFLYPGTFEEYKRFGPEFVTGSRRLGVFLSDANWNGAFLAMSLPFVGYLYAKRLIRGWQAALCFVVMVEGLLLAASVTGLICAVLGCATLVAIGGIRVPRIAIATAAMGLIGFLAAGYDLPQAFSARVAPAIEAGDIAVAGTYGGRLDLINEALTVVERTTFVGLGVDQFRNISIGFAPVHNMYLLLWSEGGILALAGWILLLLVLAGAAIQVFRRDRLAAGLVFAVLITLVAASTASPHMYARLWYVPIFVAMAFAFDCATGRGKLK